MSTTDETKPAGKSKRRKGKAERGKKAAPQAALPETPPSAELLSPGRKKQPQPARAESPKAEPQPAAVVQPVAAVVAPPEPEPAVVSPPSAPISAAPPVAEPTLAEPRPAEPELAETKSAEPPPAESSPAEPAPVSRQTIADAYRDYTRKSIEEFGAFVEQLSGARSLDKAMTVQTEFVKRAYETSVAESHKICELHNRLAKQTLDPFKGLAGKTPATHGKP
jgi:phasin family protein